MDFPFPTTQEHSDCKEEDRDLIFFQMGEPFLGFWGCHKELTLQYLVLNQFAQREEPVVDDQANFRKQASLISFNRLNPSPPSYFGKQTVSHLTKLLLRCSGSKDQRKFLISLSMRRQVLKGSGMTKAMRIGIELRTCLIRVSLPVKDRSLAFQPASLLLMESRILLKKGWRAQPKNRGTPRYEDERAVWLI